MRCMTRPSRENISGNLSKLLFQPTSRYWWLELYVESEREVVGVFQMAV